MGIFMAASYIYNFNLCHELYTQPHLSLANMKLD